MSVDKQIKASANQLKADVEILKNVVHGDETTEIQTDGGRVPSLRKRLKDIETNWSEQADPLATELAEVVKTTERHLEKMNNCLNEVETVQSKVETSQDHVQKLTASAVQARDSVLADAGSTTRAMTTMAAAITRTATLHLSKILESQQ